MCDLRRRRALVIVGVGALACALATSLGAQRPTQYDALRDYWAARSAAADARLREFRHAVDSSNSDTVHARRLDIITTPALMSIAGGVARHADSLVGLSWLPPHGTKRPQYELRPVVEVYGASDASAGDDINSQPPERKFRLAVRDASGSIKDLLTSDSARVTVEAARMAVRQGVAEPAILALPSDFRKWMVHEPAVELPTTRDFNGVWLQLAIYPSLPARGCLVGELRACETALALTGESAPVSAWYDPALRQALAARWLKRTRFDESLDTAIVRTCARGDNDAACLRFLGERGLGANMVEPGPAQMRTLLVRYAFSFPTDSAARAQAAFAPALSVQDRLERASGLPFQELLRRFHRQLSERRRPELSPASSLLWSASLWCIAFGTLSLRSTRWRG